MKALGPKFYDREMAIELLYDLEKMGYRGCSATVFEGKLYIGCSFPATIPHEGFPTPDIEGDFIDDWTLHRGPSWLHRDFWWLFD